MTEVARISVGVGANTDGFQNGMKSIDDRLKKMQNGFNRFGNYMTTRVTLPIIAGFTAAVMGAAELEGAMSKFDVVFAGMTDDMYAWVDSYREGFPLARREIITHAAALQDLMVPMEINRELAADMTKEFMEVAGALAAFNDVPIDVVLDAMKSGLAGMSRPLREFGADVTEASLKSHALTEGIWDGQSAWDAETRAVALLSKIYADSADAVDGLEEQKGSLLWMIQELKASAKDFGDELGAVLMPAIKNVVDQIIEWLSFLKDLNEEQLETIVKVGLLVAAIGPASKLMAAFIGIFRVIGSITYAFGLMGGAATTSAIAVHAAGVLMIGKLALVLAAVLALIEAFKRLDRWKNEGFDLDKPSDQAWHERFFGGESNWSTGGFMSQFHAGGTFRAPRLGGEGMAMLKDGERVLPAGVQTGEGPATNITMTITQHITDKTTADYAIDKLGRVFQSRGLVGAYR